MANVLFEIMDSDNGSIRVVVTPSVAELAVKYSKEGKISAAEALAMHLSRKALEYHQKMAQEASPIELVSSPKIIIPDMV